VGTQGAYVGVSFSIEADLITVGREVGNGIVLDQDSTVSRRHAQFLKQGDTVFVEDLGSTNGTFVNGVRISAPTPVRPGDTVQFGACAFRVE
jgi:pSer/pThr/pTyr-binding forkhead associated (FHA) protein